MDEQTRLEKAAKHLESQRGELGDAVVETALDALREKIEQVKGRGDFPAKQRKQVTILFADTVGSTRITSHLDPEDAGDMFDHVLQRLAKAVDENNGHVTRFEGDGFMAVFGSPQAHENDPELAVQAGLGIQAAAKDLASELKETWQVQDYQVRVGINTGLVAIGGTTEAEDTLMGSPVNLAKRIESAAPPGGVLISHNTYQQVRGIFDVQQQEPISAKGFEQPVPVYLVQRPKVRSLRIYLRGVEGIETPMVGRDAELNLLKDVFRGMIEKGAGKVINILGEAGIGKSRLVYEFIKWLELLPLPAVRIFQGRGRAEAQNQPYEMLREMFSFRFEILDSEPREIVLTKLEKGFGEIFGVDTAGLKRTHIISQLLGFDCRDSPYLSELLGDPQRLRELAVEYLLEYFNQLTAIKPALLYVEDMHWIDESSLEVITQLSNITGQTRLLMLCLARKVLLERHPTWGEGSEVHIFQTLKPLSARRSYQLVEEILQKAAAIPSSLSKLVVTNAEGNPYYIEELIKMLIESGVIIKGEDTWWVKEELLDQREIPPTLRGVLQARLDDLPANERLVLQLAAIMGRDFWDGSIYNMGAGAESPAMEDWKTKMKASLNSLSGRELIFRRDESTFFDNSEYSFKHLLFRDVTYETIPKRDRRAYHGLSADWLVGVTQASQRSGEYAAVIADHYLQAERNDVASDWFFQAGLHAKSQVAMREAAGFLSNSLDLLGEDDLDTRWRVLSERDEIRGILGDIQGRKEDDQALISIAEKLQDDKKLADAYYRLGFFYNSQGDYEQELEAYDKALSAARKANDQQIESLILGLKVVSLTFLAKMEQAKQSAEIALKYVRGLEDKISLAKTLGNVAVYYQLVDIPFAVQLIEESIEILDKLGEHNLKASSMINLGYTYTQSGRWDLGEEVFLKAYKLAESLENPRLMTYIQLNLGLTNFRMGKFQKAVEYLEKTIHDCLIINDSFACAACKTYLGLTLEGTGDYERAKKQFGEAWEGFKQLGSSAYAADALSGSARCALEEDQLEQANKFALEIYDSLRENGSQGMEFPILAYLTCAQVFEKIGDQERRWSSIENGYQQLMERAEKISDEGWRKIYLEDVPEHFKVLQQFQTLKEKKTHGERS